MKNKNIIVLVTFITFIFGIAIANILAPTKTYSEKEKRKLAQLPNFDKKTFLSGQYISDYEKYFNDQFISRDSWIRLHTKYEILSLKKDINGVYLGKDNYLFEDTSSYDEDKLHKNMTYIKKMLDIHSNSLGKDNISIMLVPNASEILAHKLPAYATVMDQSKILEYAQSIYKDSFINTYNILKNNNDKYIYYKTDHHWTTLGAYYAYTEWAQKTQHDIEQLKPNDLTMVSDNFLGTLYAKLNYAKEKDSIYTYKYNKNYKVIYDLGASTSNNLYELMHLNSSDQYKVFLDGNHGLTEIASTNTNGKNLIVIKDSYANSFIPFIADEYETIYVIDLRYFNISLQDFIKTNDISEILLLYNINSLSEDKNLYKITK